MSELLGVVYSIFDNHVGPQLKYCYPEDIISNETFQELSDYIIVNKNFSDRLILINRPNWLFLSYSVVINNPKYDRNTFSFSFSFILSLKTFNIESWGNVLKKIVSNLVNLEIEREFLYDINNVNKINNLIESIYNNLNLTKSIFIKLINNNYLVSKLYFYSNFLLNNFVIYDYNVPIFSNNLINFTNLPFDISFQHIIIYIDGINHVKKITKELNIDEAYIKKSLILLNFHNMIIISDIFRFTNVYKLTNNGINLLSDNNFNVLKEIFDFATLEYSDMSQPLPSLRDILNFLLCLQPKKTIKDIILEQLDEIIDENDDDDYSNYEDDNDDNEDDNGENDDDNGENFQIFNYKKNSKNRKYRFKLFNIDIGRILAYAQSRGIITRLYEYPIYLPTNYEEYLLNNHYNTTEFAFPSCHNLNDFSSQISLRDSNNLNSINPHLEENSSYQNLESIQSSIFSSSPSEIQHNQHFQNSLKYLNNQTLSDSSLSQLSDSKLNRGLYHNKQKFNKSLKEEEDKNKKNYYHNIKDYLHLLDGSEHLDSLCCKYDLNFQEILSLPGVQVIYK